MSSQIAKQDVLLKTSRLTKHFGGQMVFNSLNLELRKGQVVLLRGENGSGKTTLLNILTGALEANSGTVEYFANSDPRPFTFPRTWWQRLSLSDKFAPEFVARERIARTWQHIRLFASQTLSENIAVAHSGHRGENPLFALLSPWTWSKFEDDAQGGARRTLRRMGLTARYDSSADRISLGQAKRVAIARAIASGAEVLFLDEPLSGLDHTGATDIVLLLTSLVKDQGRTLVVVEHVLNQHRLLPIATTDWLIEDGSVHISDLRGGPVPSSGFDAPQWLSAMKTQASEWREEILPRGAILTRIRKPGAASGPGPKLLEMSALVAKRGERTAVGLDSNDEELGLSLDLHAGEIAVLQAPNGWGKTTLTEVIAGLHPLQSGTILLNGSPIETLPAWKRAKMGISTLPANSKLFPLLTVANALQLCGIKSSPDGCKALMSRKCSTLSGGERQNVALESIRHSLVSVYDEPFLGLDAPRILKTVTRYLTEAQGCQLLLVPRAL
jgi:branched-chain amino acid transport system ATP-binding protein